MTADNAEAKTGEPVDSGEADGAPELKAESRAEGAGFRAVITEGGRAVWACNHVHFTDHSAKADAQARLREMQPTAA
jgi:hypothetical protein